MQNDLNEKRKRQVTNAPGGGRWKIYSLVFVSVMIFASGFFFAARQHFSSIDYCIRNSRLRKQLDDLETEKRRLLVARETHQSPAEIRKAAKKFGIGAEVASYTAAPAPATPKNGMPAKADLVKKTVLSRPDVTTVAMSKLSTNISAASRPAEKTTKISSRSKKG